MRYILKDIEILQPLTVEEEQLVAGGVFSKVGRAFSRSIAFANSRNVSVNTVDASGVTGSNVAQEFFDLYNRLTS